MMVLVTHMYLVSCLTLDKPLARALVYCSQLTIGGIDCCWFVWFSLYFGMRWLVVEFRFFVTMSGVIY